MSSTKITTGMDAKVKLRGSDHGSVVARPTKGEGQRRAEIVIAALFVLTAATSIPAAFALDPMLNVPDYLAKVFPNQAALVLDALLWSFNNIGIVFIAVFAFP